MKQDEQEANELKQVAPHLAAVPKVNPFRVPDGYFEKLERQVLEETREPYPAFEKKEPHTAFDVPAGYFDELPLIISAKISEKKSARILPLLPKPAFALAIAAAFLAILLITRPALWFGNSQPPVTETLTVDELGNSTYLAGLDEHLLIEALEATDTPDPLDRNAASDVENYLIDNHIDLNQISD